MIVRVRADRSRGDAIAIDTGGGEPLLLSHGDNPTSLFDPIDGRIIEVNDAWVATYGWSRDEAKGLSVRDVSAEPESTMRAVAKARNTGGAVVALRWHRRRDGHVFPVELTSGTIRAGEQTLMYAVMRDVTERTRADAELAHSETRLRAIFDALPDAVLVQREGKVLYHNRAFAVMHGFGADDDLTGRTVESFVHHDDRFTARQRVRRVQEAGDAAPPRETRLLCRDGTTIPAEIRGLRIEFAGESAVLAIARDLRHQRALEAQLVLSDRLAALGRLAASVGHEINNPIAYAMATLELLRREIDDATDVGPATRARLLDRVGVVEEGARRVRDIVRDLRGLSVTERRVVGAVDINRVVDVCANMADHEIRHHARLTRVYGDGLAVCADEARLSQVFLNVLVNAAQSIPGGDPEANEIRVRTYAEADDQLVVEVCDTGCGLPRDLRERVFEPFFTTREAEGGTGLGLSISQSIVAAYGGSIDIDDNPPRGTCVRVRLPRAPHA